MPGAYWCMVEDDRQGAPKKVMAEVLGEATRVAGAAGAQAEAVWVTDRATPEGLKLLGEWGAKRIWLFENAAFSSSQIRLAPHSPSCLIPSGVALSVTHTASACAPACPARREASPMTSAITFLGAPCRSSSTMHQFAPGMFGPFSLCGCFVRLVF